MRIVIVSANFDDRSRIGSSRPRSFAMWLARFGHHVTVVTQSVDHAATSRSDMQGVEVVRFGRVAPMRRARETARRLNGLLKSRSATTSPSSKSADPARSAHVSTKSLALSTASLGFRAVDDALWVASVAKKLRQMPEPEIIFSSYGPLSSLWLGGRLAKAWPSAVWVADFRDLVVGDFYPGLVNGRLAGIQRRAVAEAEAVTTISHGLQEVLVEDLPPELQEKVHVLPNGFEAGSYQAPSYENRADTTLRIGYTGNMYAGRRDASALFHVLRALMDSAAIDPRMVEVHYAGKDSAVFLEQAASAGVRDVVVDHGFVGREQALDLQSQSDILLVLSWNTSGQRGVLTGKLFEYLASGRPVLALTGGDLPGAELTELVNDLELGLAFEYVTQKSDVEDLRSFLLDAYDRRQRRESLFLRSTDAIRAYEYETIARRLEALLVLQLSRRAIP